MAPLLLSIFGGLIMAMVVSVPGNASDTAGVPGNNKYVIKTCTFSGTYAGASLTPTMLGLEQIHLVLCSSDSSGGANSGYVPQYDYTNQTLDLYVSSGDGNALEEASGTVAEVVRVIAFGR